MEDMEDFLSRLPGDHGGSVAVRLCVPVVDAPDVGSEPGSIRMPCGACGQECWYDSTMILPLPEDTRELVVCNHCAMSSQTLSAVLMAVSWPGSQPPSWN